MFGRWHCRHCGESWNEDEHCTCPQSVMEAMYSRGSSRSSKSDNDGVEAKLDELIRLGRRNGELLGHILNKLAMK